MSSGRLIHENETAGFLLSCDLLTDARSDDLGYLRALLTFSDRSQLHVREYVRVSDDRVERLALAYHYQDAAGALGSATTTPSIARRSGSPCTSMSARISCPPTV